MGLSTFTSCQNLSFFDLRLAMNYKRLVFWVIQLWEEPQYIIWGGYDGYDLVH